MIVGVVVFGVIYSVNMHCVNWLDHICILRAVIHIDSTIHGLLKTDNVFMTSVT